MEVSGKTKGISTEDNTGNFPIRDGKLFCQPCSSDGDMVVAIGYCKNCTEYFCAVCLKVHRKQAVSRNHKILDGDNMPKLTSPSARLCACSDICPMHVDEIIKYYCSSHDLVGCSDCMIIGHKSCKVDRIQDISTDYFNGTEHQDIVQKVEQFVKSVDKIKSDLQANEQDMKYAFEKAVKDVQTFKKEIVEYLDKAEREMLVMLATNEERDKSLIRKLKLEEKRLDDDILEIQTTLQLQQNQANKLFVEAKQVKAKLCYIEENLEELKKDVNIHLYQFCRSPHIGQIIDSALKLGELSMIYGDTGKMVAHEVSNEKCVSRIADNTILDKENIFEMDAYLDFEINVKLPDDAYDCSVDDCVLMSRNQLLIADSANTCIKIVDVKNKNVSKYKVRSSSRGVAVVNPSLIAVTLPIEGKIQFLAITDGNKFTERDMIKVDKECGKIAISTGQIIGLTHRSVEIMSISGQKLRSISHPKLASGHDIAVVSSSRIFYVSNSSYNNTAVYKFDFDGNLIATYRDTKLVEIRGLEVTKDGTLLVCSWTSDGSIHMITPGCKKIKELFKQNGHVSYPWCVAFCDETNKLFIANYENTLDKKMKNVLKVFQLK